MPNWTKEELNAFLARCAVSSPKPESIAGNESVAKKEGKSINSGRVLVRIVSYRRRLLDPDNLCPKYFIDCLRYAEIIKNDREEDIELSVTQRKVNTRQEERTEIFVEDDAAP